MAKDENNWTGKQEWKPEDVKAGLRVRLQNRKIAVIMQARWGGEAGGGLDRFIMAAAELDCYMPDELSAEKMAAYLNSFNFVVA